MADYKQLYGKDMRELALHFGVTPGWIGHLHKQGRLQECLIAGRIIHKPRPDNSTFRKIYGMNGREIAKKFNVCTGTVWQFHKNGTLQHKIDTGFPKPISAIEAIFGISLYDATKKLNVTRQRIYQLRDEGRLKTCLDAGFIVHKKEYSSKYTRKWGLSLRQLSKKTGKSVDILRRLSNKGLLAEAISTDCWLSNYSYIKQYGMLNKEIAKKLNCPRSNVSVLHKFGVLHLILERQALKKK